MRNRLSSAKHSSLLTKAQGRNSSASNLELTNTSRHSYGLSLAGKAKKSTRRVLHCEKLSAHPTEILDRLSAKTYRSPFKTEDTPSLGFEDAEHDSVLLELADLMSIVPAKPTRMKMSHRVVETEVPLKNSVRSLARLKPLNPESLMSPPLKNRTRAKTSRNGLWARM